MCSRNRRLFREVTCAPIQELRCGPTHQIPPDVMLHRIPQMEAEYMTTAELSGDEAEGGDELSARTNPDNPDPRVACAILLDTSSSMSGEPIRLLNEGFALFCDEIKKDALAKKRTEVVVITFGGVPRVEIPFTEGRDLEARQFIDGGGTPLGGAVNLALDELEAQKKAYKLNGLEYLRPWLFVLSDGQPTDGEVFDAAVGRIGAAVDAKGVSSFAIGIGEGADMTQLKKLSPGRDAIKLQGLSFREFFLWLSASMSVVSNSVNAGTTVQSGGQLEPEAEQRALPSPEGWAQW